MVSSLLFIQILCSSILFIVVIAQHRFNSINFHKQNLENNCQNKYDDFFSAQIFVFYAPRRTDKIKEQIVIYYYNPGFKPDDVIAISRNNTIEKLYTNIFYYLTSMKGIIFTRIRPSILNYDNSSIYKHQYTGYSVAWLRNGRAMKKFDVSSHPDWMYEQRYTIKYQKISSVMIPGTHNSGSYIKADVQSTIEQFSVTQDTDIMEQLISGARYFDLRPGSKNGYWIYHGNFFMNKMDKIIDDIKTFMSNTQEIVILSFKEFPIGFHDDSDHRKFIKYLEKQFDKYLLPRASKLWEITFRDIWKLGKRLIICYDHKIYQQSDKLWPTIPQMWGDIRMNQGLDGLKDYLASVETKVTSARVSMTEFIMDAWSVSTHAAANIFGIPHTSLRQLAAEIGPHITQWYNELFYQHANIIAVDYMDATGIVEVAIDWNKRRSSLCYDHYINLMT